MTYNELLSALKKLTQEQLQKDVTVETEGRVVMAELRYPTEGWRSDVLGKDHPVIFIL